MHSNKIKNWENVPFELKEIIAKSATENTRNSLKVCSFNEKCLVEKVRLRTVYSMDISYDGAKDKWKIEINETDSWFNYRGRNCPTFYSFAEFQQGLSDLLRWVDCIKYLTFSFMTCLSTPILYTAKDIRKTILVENLDLNVGSSEVVKKILSQIEPGYLRTVRINSDWGNPTVYDMPQIISAECLYVKKSCSIREIQLLKLTARSVDLDNIKCSLIEYIKKCTLDAATKFPEFVFDCPQIYAKTLQQYGKSRAYLKTAHPFLKLCLSSNDNIYQIRGQLKFEALQPALEYWKNDSSIFRKVRSLKIEYDYRRGWMFAAQRENYPDMSCETQNIQEFQKWFDIIIQNVDYIKELNIDLKQKSRGDLVMMPRAKQLTVGKLNISVRKNKFLCNLLRQIEPFHLKELVIKTESDQDAIFNIESVQECDYVKIEGAHPCDDQLVKMNASLLSTGVRKAVLRNYSTTARGVNRFLKKCLLNLNEKRYYVKFQNFRHRINLDKVLKDLDAVLMFDESGELDYVNINSDNRYYIIRLDVSQRFLLFQRVRRD